MTIDIEGGLIFQNGVQVRMIESRKRYEPNRWRDMQKGLVYHHTASRFNTHRVAHDLAMSDRAASAHVMVGLDGEIIQLMPLEYLAWHAGPSRWRGTRGCNYFTWGIELVNPGRLELERLSSGADAFRSWFDVLYSGDQYPIMEATTEEHGHGYWVSYSEKQLDAALELGHAFKKHLNIGFVTTHYEISPGRKIDPSPFFPIAEFRSKIFGRNSSDLDNFDGYVVVNSNCRRWPSTRSHIIGVIPRGSTLEVIRSGVFDGARWHLVKTVNIPSDQKDHLEGWVYGNLIDLV